jgi:nucleolar protein 9
LLQVIAADATIVMSSCYGSHVLWQTALRLSSGDDSELHHIISILLGYDEDDIIHKNSFIEKKSEIVSLL